MACTKSQPSPAVKLPVTAMRAAAWTGPPPNDRAHAPEKRWEAFETNLITAETPVRLRQTAVGPLEKGVSTSTTATVPVWTPSRAEHCYREATQTPPEALASWTAASLGKAHPDTSQDFPRLCEDPDTESVDSPFGHEQPPRLSPCSLNSTPLWRHGFIFFAGLGSCV